MGTPRVKKHFEAVLPVLEGPHTPQNPNSCWGCWSNANYSPQEPWGSSAGRFLPSSQLGQVGARHPAQLCHGLGQRAVLPERLCLRCWPSTKEFIFNLSQHTANSKCLNLSHSGRAEVGAESQLRRAESWAGGCQAGPQRGHTCPQGPVNTQVCPQGEWQQSGASP